MLAARQADFKGKVELEEADWLLLALVKRGYELKRGREIEMPRNSM